MRSVHSFNNSLFAASSLCECEKIYVKNMRCADTQKTQASCVFIIFHISHAHISLSLSLSLSSADDDKPSWMGRCAASQHLCVLLIVGSAHHFILSPLRNLQVEEELYAQEQQQQQHICICIYSH